MEYYTILYYTLSIRSIIVPLLPALSIFYFFFWNIKRIAG